MAIENIFDYIEVTPPYFALENLRQNEEGFILAKIPIQQPLDMEVGYISTAEAGRHLAILGSCSVAMSNSHKSKHYYLAYHAEYFNKAAQENYEILNYINAVAKGKLINKRTAISECFMLKDNNIIATLKVLYHVISENIFEKIYKNFQIHTNFDETLNPYEIAMPIQNISIINRKLTASLGEILASNCYGHFQRFPAMPVAILSSSLNRASGYLLKEILQQNDFKYIVRSVIVKAENLAFAGEIVNLEVEFLNSHDNNYVFRGKAIANSTKEVGDLLITLNPVF